MITLRRIRNTDARFPQVWALREEILRKPLRLSLRNEDLSDEAAEHIIIAIDDEQKVIGCIMLRILPGNAGKLRQMAVAADWQGKGIGAKIMAEAETFAGELGLRHLSFHARQTAIPFYEKLGYIAYGEPFEEVGIPHIAMQKDIS